MGSSVTSMSNAEMHLLLGAVLPTPSLTGPSVTIRIKIKVVKRKGPDMPIKPLDRNENNKPNSASVMALSPRLWNG